MNDARTPSLQGVIENEVDLNSLGTCKDQCSSYVVSETHGCFKDLFCAKQRRCNGRLYDCTFYDADAWVCMSGANRERRYDWVEYEDGTMLGRKSDQCVSKWTCALGTNTVVLHFFSNCRQDQGRQLVEMGILALLVLPLQVRRRRGAQFGQVLVAQTGRCQRRPEHGRHRCQVREEGPSDPVGN